MQVIKVHHASNAVDKRCNLRHFSHMAVKLTKQQQAARALEARFEACLGGHGTTARLARAIEMSPSQLHRIWAAKSGLPGWLEAMVEFLEATPEEQWPQRWRK